ncbi:MAG: hypothetical protein MH204_11425 [Fimbriimonadaceae bacterium]|nr:hypothetical protein [Fimbriimonadaceae bacterium]
MSAEKPAGLSRALAWGGAVGAVLGAAVVATDHLFLANPGLAPMEMWLTMGFALLTIASGGVLRQQNRTAGFWPALGSAAAVFFVAYRAWGVTPEVAVSLAGAIALHLMLGAGLWHLILARKSAQAGFSVAQPVSVLTEVKEDLPTRLKMEVEQTRLALKDVQETIHRLIHASADADPREEAMWDGRLREAFWLRAELVEDLEGLTRRSAEVSADLARLDELKGRLQLAASADHTLGRIALARADSAHRQADLEVDAEIHRSEADEITRRLNQVGHELEEARLARQELQEHSR